MGKLTWLHLSDWHQHDQPLDYSRTKVRDALLKDIEERERISEKLANIDLIIFSGDLTFSGIHDEYEEAIVSFLEPIRKAANVAREQLIIVPGNHDLVRAIAQSGPRNLLRELRTPDKVQEW